MPYAAVVIPLMMEVSPIGMGSNFSTKHPLLTHNNCTPSFLYCLLVCFVCNVCVLFIYLFAFLRWLCETGGDTFEHLHFSENADAPKQSHLISESVHFCLHFRVDFFLRQTYTILIISAIILVWKCWSIKTFTFIRLCDLSVSNTLLHLLMHWGKDTHLLAPNLSLVITKAHFALTMIPGALCVPISLIVTCMKCKNSEKTKLSFLTTAKTYFLSYLGILSDVIICSPI